MTDLLQRLRERKLVQWALAYVAFAFALIQVLDVVAQRFGWPDQLEKLLILALVIGFFVTLVLAWYHGERGAQRVSGTELLILALLLAIGGGLLWRFAHAPDAATATSALAATASRPTPAAPAKSIAVLPFVNMSAVKDNEFFSDGVSEEILNSLARIPALKVVGRTSSFQFKGHNEDLRVIGEKLGVAHVLEGSVRREGERARITAQLIRASDGYHLWSETYDRTLNDTLAVQLDIAEKVAGALDVLLDDTQRKRMRDAGISNVDAFIHYQKGWKLYVDAHRGVAGGLLEGLRLANAEFDQAIVLEPNYSMAHYAKADLYEHTLIDDGTTQAQRLAAQRGALQTLERAAATSPDAQQREFALAERQMLSDDWRGLANRLSSALAQPGCSAPNWMPVFASVFGYGEQLEPVLQRAAVCDPLNGITWNTRGWVARVIGKPDRIASIYAQWRSYRPDLPPTSVEFLAQAMLGRQDKSQALPVPSDNLDSGGYAIAMQVARLRGMDRAQAHAWVGPVNRDRGNIRDWQTVDLTEAALFGDRAEANRHAALLDARPAGGLLLAIATGYCGCGAPFDLDATPNFKARLAESGLPWPPPVAVAYPPLAGNAKP